MGPCQGGFCTYRLAGLIHQLAAQERTNLLAPGSAAGVPDRRILIEKTDLALRDFLQERWKGLLPILWGQQLRQERLDELIYLSVLNVDHLPGPAAGPLTASPYLSPPEDTTTPPAPAPTAQVRQVAESAPASLDLLVIGGGLAGLFAAWQAALYNKKVRLVSKGWGSLYWNAGAIDVLGYDPLDAPSPVEELRPALAGFIAAHPEHPYAIAGLDCLDQALEALKQLSAQMGYPLHGSLERNYLLPSALGVPRPTCLAPQTMIAGDLRQPGEMLIIGIERYPDFYPHLAAENLASLGIPARAAMIQIDSLCQTRLVNTRILAESCASGGVLAEIAAAIKPLLGAAQRVGLPAILGYESAAELHQRLQDMLGVPVFEIPTLPPSIPGIRLHRLLTRAIEAAGGRVSEGMQVLGADAAGSRIVQVWSEAAARHKPHPAKAFLLATGGLLGGGTRSSLDGYALDTVFSLPVPVSPARSDWFDPRFLAPTGHPIFRAGIPVDRSLQPVLPTGQPVFANLYAAGAALGGAEPVRERSVEGIALATACAALRTIVQRG
jgi:glycerol-3-phosphate dehydrogenase subunit B